MEPRLKVFLENLPWILKQVERIIKPISRALIYAIKVGSSYFLSKLLYIGQYVKKSQNRWVCLNGVCFCLKALDNIILCIQNNAVTFPTIPQREF